VLISAETIRSVTLADLFAQADQVAVVKVVAGDSEHYGRTVYKSVVESAYKGTSERKIIYFGPYDGTRIGWKYVVFLKKGAAETPKTNDTLSFGSIESVSREMYEGYGTLPVDYECVFDGAAVGQQCDYGVQLNPEQVVLPKLVKTFPKGDAGAVTNYKKWVRESALNSQLEALSKSNSQVK